MTDDKVGCTFCEGGKRVVSLTESNEYFISKRISDGNIDEAITIARVDWDNFSTLRESADIKKIVEPLLREMQKTWNIQTTQLLTTINTSSTSLEALISTLEKNPELIQKSSKETIDNLTVQFGQLETSINNGTMMQIQQMLSQYIYKPNVKGSVGEKVLAEIWQGKFERDLVEEIGGKGKVDLLVTPYLNTSINRHGDRISVERKSGMQKYTAKHLDDAVRHAIENGVAYSIIIYDTQDNLPQKPMIIIENDVLVAIVDIESGTWKMARDIFGILQTEMLLQKKKMNEINIQSIQQVATDIGTLLKIASEIRGKTTKFQKEMEKDLGAIEEAVKGAQTKLIEVVSGGENGGV